MNETNGNSVYVGTNRQIDLRLWWLMSDVPTEITFEVSENTLV